MQQFLRKVVVEMAGSGKRLSVNSGSDPKDLRVDFNISKNTSSTQNRSTISIYNLNEHSRNSVGREFDNITIYAGYAPSITSNNVGAIFSGQVRDVRHITEGKDIITTISLGDGDNAVRKATISKSYPAGTQYSAIVEDIYKTYEDQGVTRGQWNVDLSQKTTRPLTLYGSSARELDTIGRTKNFYWSIQNNTMEIIGAKDSISGIFILSENTGLVGVPIITDKGINIKALINPQVRPNRKIKVISKVLRLNDSENIYRVGKIDYNGSNRIDEFTMLISAEKTVEGKVV